MLGLTLALRLAEQGRRVTLFEAADRLGGLADAWQLGEVVWDRHYHVTLLSDVHLRRLLADLRLDDDMRWVQTRTGFLAAGRLMSLSNVWDFVKFPLVGLVDKLRLAWTISSASRRNDWQELEKIPVGDWLIAQSGRRTFERIWLPLLKAKLGDAWQRTSAAFIWATIQRMYAARRTGLKREMFGYLPGGYARTLAALRERLTALGVTIRTGSRVEHVERSDETGPLRVTMAGGEKHAFDAVVVTTPAPVAARMCPQLSTTEAQRLENVEYLGIVCASVLVRKPLAGFYVTNVIDPAPFTGVIEMTALVNPAELAGNSLVYLPKYATSDDPIWSRSDEEIRTEFLDAMSRLYPGFDATSVQAFRVSRVRHVFALSTLNYSSKVPPFTTSVPGLFLVNSAQIVNGTLNVNETVRLANSALATVLGANEPSTHENHATTDCELVARS